jgi:hypothetical protein
LAHLLSGKKDIALTPQSSPTAATISILDKRRAVVAAHSRVPYTKTCPNIR